MPLATAECSGGPRPVASPPAHIRADLAVGPLRREERSAHHAALRHRHNTPRGVVRSTRLSVHLTPTGQPPQPDFHTARRTSAADHAYSAQTERRTAHARPSFISPRSRTLPRGERGRGDRGGVFFEAPPIPRAQAERSDARPASGCARSGAGASLVRRGAQARRLGCGPWLTSEATGKPRRETGSRCFGGGSSGCWRRSATCPLGGAETSGQVGAAAAARGLGRRVALLSARAAPRPVAARRPRKGKSRPPRRGQRMETRRRVWSWRPLALELLAQEAHQA